MDFAKLIGEPPAPDDGGYLVRGQWPVPRITQRCLAALFAGAGSAFVFHLGGGFGFGDLFESPPVDLVLGLVVLAVVWQPLKKGLWRPEMLRIDGNGVRIDDALVPWQSIRQLVILQPPPRSGAFTTILPPQGVGLRLFVGARLPEGTEALVVDPSDPYAIPEPLRTSETIASLDESRLRAAVAACAPPHVELVERVGETERVLPRPAEVG